MRRWLILALLALVVLAAAGIAVFEGVPETAPGRAAPDVAPVTARRDVAIAPAEIAPEPERELVVADETRIPVAGGLRVRARAARDGRSIAGLPCAVRRPTTEGIVSFEGTTDAAGEAHFSGLAPGAVDVRFDGLDPRAVEIEADRETVVEFDIARVLAIEGLVVDETDAPVAGAEVIALLHADWHVPDRRCPIAITDDAGRFAAACSSVGWKLAAAKGDRRSALVSPGTGNGEFVGEGSSRIRIVIAPATVVVQGRVFRAGGVAVASGGITLLTARARSRDPLAPLDRSIESCAIASDGSFRVACRCGGAAELIVASPGRGTAIVPLTLPESGTVTIDPVLGDEARLDGVVLDEDGRALAGAMVAARGAGRMEPFFETATRDDGSYTLRNLPRGTSLSLTATAPLHDPDRRQVVTLDADRTRQDFLLVRQGVIGGRLLRADGSPLAGWRVEARRGGERDERRLARTDQNGRFAVGTDRDAHVQLFAIPRETNLRVPLADGRLLPTANDAPVDFVLRDDELPSAFVSGRVLAAGSTTHERFDVYLHDGVTRGQNLRRVGADGSFTIGPVPSRRYRLLARTSDGVERELAQFDLATSQRLQLGDLRPR